MFRRSLRNALTGNPSEAVEPETIELFMPFVGDGCTECGKCSEACPCGAIAVGEEWTIDLGKCIFCMECLDACPESSIWKVPAPLYAIKREELVFSPSNPPAEATGMIDEDRRNVLGRSISIRELDTGSCNACECEINCLSAPHYDFSRFGLHITASPRHADMLLVTGPMTKNMRTAALMTYEATPAPKIVVAVGTCAISGGIFVKGDVCGNGIADTLETDMFIPGCPPAPGRIMAAILKAMGHQ